ncbi:MAG TPA: anti-sigma factor [Caulobacteraceae bacterium]|jgi:anti-sigma-K factor RskA|nr:anti-sigma factor [Caulobacteraceae bacterium]
MSAGGPDDLDRMPDLTAGEYVLGVLDAAESAIARRRIATEPTFAAEVAYWEGRLLPLVEQVPPATPRTAVWEAIASRLTAPRQAENRSRPNSWENLALWRGLALASTALAAVSIAMVIGARAPRPVKAPAPLAVARLERPNDGGVAFVATLDPTRRQLVLTPTGRPIPPGRSTQLWLLPPNGAPVSLGLTPGHATAFALPWGLGSTSTLAVSLEPVGGSPTGAPTGPVIAAGKLARLAPTSPVRPG